jgi:hypothetical protein
MKDLPPILNIEVSNVSIYNWLKSNQYVIFSELIRYSEKMIEEDVESIQALMISNSYDNIVFIVKKENVDLMLNKAMEYFLEIEEYEQCVKIRNLFILIEKKKNETKDSKISKSNKRKSKIN